MNNRNRLSEAVTSGMIALMIGLLITFVVSYIWFPPWTLTQSFIAVGTASFFAAFFAIYLRRQRTT